MDKNPKHVPAPSWFGCLWPNRNKRKSVGTATNSQQTQDGTSSGRSLPTVRTKSRRRSSTAPGTTLSAVSETAMTSAMLVIDSARHDDRQTTPAAPPCTPSTDVVQPHQAERPSGASRLSNASRAVGAGRESGAGAVGAGEVGEGDDSGRLDRWMDTGVVGNIVTVATAAAFPEGRRLMQEEYLSRTYENTAPSLVDGRRLFGRLVDVYDADTLTCVVEVSKGTFQRATVRLLGIDVCEMTSKLPKALAVATKARDAVVTHLTNDAVHPDGADRASVRGMLQSDVYIVGLAFANRPDKYGRLLAIVHRIDPATLAWEKSAAHLLLERALAVPYDGLEKRMNQEDLARFLDPPVSNAR
jgi:endonuclease YncB( thermonuclease family)